MQSIFKSAAVVEVTRGAFEEGLSRFGDEPIRKAEFVADLVGVRCVVDEIDRRTTDHQAAVKEALVQSRQESLRVTAETKMLAEVVRLLSARLEVLESSRRG